MSYRRDSIFDVHVTLDHLFRYIHIDSGIVEFLRSPDEDDIGPFRGRESIRQDAQLIADIVDVYLKVSGQDELFEAFKLLVGS